MPAFDPETSGAPFDPETTGQAFDIEGSGAPAVASDRLQALAPLVARPDSTPEDERAYADAYKDYYNEHSRASALGSSVGSVASSVGSALAHPIDTGQHLWDAVKSEWKNSEVLGGPNASNDEKAQIINKGFLRTILGDPRAVMGAAKGAGSALYQGANVAGAGLEQWANLSADLKNKYLTGVSAEDSESAREYAAQQAIQRLKMGAKASQLLAPSTTGTGSDAATELGGNLIGQAAVGGELPGAGLANDATKAASDFLGNAVTTAAGAMLKAAKPAVNTGIYGGGAYLAAKGIQHAPIETTAALLGSGIAGHGVLGKINSIKGQLFARTSELGNQLFATPLGKSAIDSIVEAAPERIQSANQELNGYRAALEDLETAKTAAEKSGQTTIPFTKQIKQAQAAVDAANLKAHVITQGAKTAQFLQSSLAGGIPKKLADSVAGAITGGITGAAIGAANSQPGERDKTATGAYIGGVLGMLGAAALGAHDTIAQGEIGDLTPPPPRVGDQPQAAPLSPPPNVPSAPETAPPGQPSAIPESISDLRATADRLAKNTFVIDGRPHDTATLAESLDKVSKTFSNAARKDSLALTFDIPTTPAFGSEHYQTVPADQEITDLKSQWQPPPIKNGQPSKVFTKMAYSPERQAWSGEFHEPGHAEVIHYYGPDMKPEEWQAWMDAESIGRHFNTVIKKQFPVIRVHDGPTGLTDANAISNKQGFKTYIGDERTASPAPSSPTKNPAKAPDPTTPAKFKIR